jgi:hypothetical protein
MIEKWLSQEGRAWPIVSSSRIDSARVPTGDDPPFPDNDLNKLKNQLFGYTLVSLTGAGDFPCNDRDH